MQAIVRREALINTSVNICNRCSESEAARSLRALRHNTGCGVGRSGSELTVDGLMICNVWRENTKCTRVPAARGAWSSTST